MLLIKSEKFIWLTLLLGLIYCGCQPNTDSVTGPEHQNPVIDFRAFTESLNEDNEFNQVLIRIQILHTNTDILKYGITTPEEHQARLNYYRVDFKKVLHLISQGDTLPCYDLHAERLYMDLPYMNFIATFHHPITIQDEILIHDEVYTNMKVVAAIEQNEETK